ncbi:hypothetical protein BH24PSE2_BH24PSE2_04890 [soil metagenome]
MSFILDALKKSEIERQEQAGPSVAHVREAAPETRRPLWVAAIAALLVINLIALLIFALRSPAESPASAAVDAADEVPVPASRPPPVQARSTRPAAPAASRPEVRPLAAEAQAPAAVERTVTAPSPTAGGAAPPQPAPSDTDDSAGLSTFEELTVAGRLALPPLHLDIHVYSDTPAARFVFIDGRKYREGERLSAGPQIEQITETGVIMSHQDERFLLPRM